MKFSAFSEVLPCAYTYTYIYLYTQIHRYINTHININVNVHKYIFLPFHFLSLLFFFHIFSRWYHTFIYIYPSVLHTYVSHIYTHTDINIHLWFHCSRGGLQWANEGFLNAVTFCKSTSAPGWVANIFFLSSSLQHFHSFHYGHIHTHIHTHG